MYCVYLITREDNKKYIGKAKNIKQRMSQHRKTKRFLGFNFNYEILFVSEDHESIIDAEKLYITWFDTYRNGLNLTPDGSGNNYTEKFSTFGFSWSDEHKNKLKQNHWSKTNKITHPMKGKKHTEDTKKIWSAKRKGKVFHTKFDETLIRNIFLLYKSRPFLECENTTQKNGRVIDYDSAFCIKNSKKFNMSIPNMKKIIKGKTIAWKNLYNEIIVSKS